MILSFQGDAITLSRRLWEKGVHDVVSLRAMMRSEAPRKPVFAVVSPFSGHLYLLRKWLTRGGIDPDRDIRVALLPPALVAEHMREGYIDGFCVGEPWNSAAVMAREGWIAATSQSLEPGHPEKLLLVTENLLQERAEEYGAIRRALLAACRFCEVAENRPAIVDLLQKRNLFPFDKAVLANALVGSFQSGVGALPTSVSAPTSRAAFMSFDDGDGNRASRDRAAWFLKSSVETHALQIEAHQRKQCLDAFRDLSSESAPNA